MDEFEELSGSEATAPAPALVDPASEFLEREKEELGDVLGETQGVKSFGCFSKWREDLC